MLHRFWPPPLQGDSWEFAKLSFVPRISMPLASGAEGWDEDEVLSMSGDHNIVA